jgi:Mycothiol maleylpyruvate isomerase N-terminal domain
VDTTAAFELAGAHALRVIADPAVSTHWDDPSVLPRMTVGALAGHLLAVVRTFERRCDLETTGTETLVDLAAGYAPTRLDRHADLDEPRFRSVREGAARVAERGAVKVASEFAACLTRLVARLQTDPPQVVQLPDPMHAAPLRAYTITRVVELVVHTDDLARSAGVAVAAPDPEVAELVIDFLVSADRHRIGDADVLRALAGRADPDELRAL